MKEQLVNDFYTLMYLAKTGFVVLCGLLSFFLPKKGIISPILRLIFGPARWSLQLSWWLVKRCFRGLKWLFKRFKKPKGPMDLSMEQIDSMGNGDGRAFEEYVASLYRGLGHEAYTTTELRQMGKLPKAIMEQSGVGEQGVDVVVYVNRPEGKQKIIIQCKHYSSKVGNKAVQEISTAMKMYEAHKAVVISNQEFTAPAINLAKANDVLLIGRGELPRLIKNAVNNFKQVA